MRVYALMGDYEFEGESLLGIYSTLEKACAAKKDWEDDDFDFLDVDEWEVDK